MESKSEYILRTFGKTDGDDLERANAAFRNMTPQQLDVQWGASGKTARWIWDGYKARRKFHQECYVFLEAAIRKAESNG